jgi:shikimate kinase
VLNGENIKDFAGSGTVVCLSAAPETILKRVAGDTNRPLLEKGDKGARITTLLRSRQELYDAIPLRVDTTGLTPEQVADEVMEMVNSEW